MRRQRLPLRTCCSASRLGRVPRRRAAGARTSIAALRWATRASRSALPLPVSTRDRSDAARSRGGVSRFRGRGRTRRRTPARRLGAAADRLRQRLLDRPTAARASTCVRPAVGTVVGSGGRRGSRDAALAAHGDFAPAAASAAAGDPDLLRGLAVTERALPRGRRAAADSVPRLARVRSPAAGGPPLETLAGPTAGLRAARHRAAAAAAELAVLDRVAAPRLDARSPARHAGGLPVAGRRCIAPGRASSRSTPDVAPPREPPRAARLAWFDLASDAAGGADPVAIEVLGRRRACCVDGRRPAATASRCCRSTSGGDARRPRLDSRARST